MNKDAVAQGTSKTDAFIAELESELGDGPPHISEAAIDVSIRLSLIAFARQLEAEVAALSAQHQGTVERLGKAFEELTRRETRILELSAQVVELQKALRSIVEGEFDDLDPDDGLHTTSARAVARNALKE